MMYPTQLPAPLATHRYHRPNYFAILDGVDPEDDVTVVASNKAKATNDTIASTEYWTDKESTYDKNVLWEQSVPILDEGNNQGLYLASSPAGEISIPAVTPIVPIIIPPQISIPTRSNATKYAVGTVCSHPRLWK